MKDKSVLELKRHIKSLKVHLSYCEGLLANMVPPPKSGICRECGCTKSNPCFLSPSGDYCSWVDQAKTLCSDCV